MTWTAVFAPAGTPRPTVDILNRALIKAMTSLQVREQLNAIGTEIVMSTPEELDVFVKSEIVRAGDIVQRAGVRLE